MSKPFLTFSQTMSITESLLEQLPDRALDKLKQFDRFWESYRQPSQKTPNLVEESNNLLSGTECDVAIAGGTLGIIIGCALQRRGWQVVLFEKGILRGRVQEWNIARRELQVLLDLELLNEQELESAIDTEYNPGRIGFGGGKDIWVRDVLNLGVNPIVLLELLKQKFLDAGGSIWEQTELHKTIVHADGVAVYLQQNQTPICLKARLLLDVMGHFSAIATQSRQGNRPDGICMVVGSCAQGIPAKDYGDLFYSFTPIQNACQYFWEAFPAQDGRTTYLFTYADLDPDRPSFYQLFEDYFHWLPQYQDVDIRELRLQRVLYGFFPSYKRSPLQPQWHRILQVGDSSGSQSPLSFGGFGALIRHLSRLTEGICEALQWNLLSRQDLCLLQPYQPNLSVTWLFQQAMRIPVNQQYHPQAINDLLAVAFQTMENLGDRTLKPFLQDVIQFPALSQTMFGMLLADPILVAKIAKRVGLPALLDWMKHFVMLGGYSLSDRFSKSWASSIPNLLPEQQYALNCQINAWKYGSGMDYEN
jgi:lycopene cyclase CruP